MPAYLYSTILYTFPYSYQIPNIPVIANHGTHQKLLCRSNSPNTVCQARDKFTFMATNFKICFSYQDIDEKETDRIKRIPEI